MSPHSFSLPAPMRWLLVAALVPVLYFLTTETFFAACTWFWQTVLAGLGLDGLLHQLQSGVSREVTTRSLPAIATFAVLYFLLSMLTLRLILRTRARMRVVVQVYGAVFLAYVLLVLAAKLTHDTVWVYRLARNLIDFLLSPLPIVILGPLLWNYHPAARPAPRAHSQATLAAEPGT